MLNSSLQSNLWPIQLEFVATILLLTFQAIQHGRLDCVELLAKRGHNFDEKDSNGITPLHVAISHNESGISEFLIREARVQVDEADYV